MAAYSVTAGSTGHKSADEMVKSLVAAEVRMLQDLEDEMARSSRTDFTCIFPRADMAQTCATRRPPPVPHWRAACSTACS